MKKKSFLILLLALVLLLALPVTASAATTKYVKTNSGTNLRMRSGPSTDYEIVDHIPYGGKVTVKATQGSWSQVTYNGTTAWVSSRYLVSTKPTKKTVTSNTAPVSSGSSTGAVNGTMFSGFSFANYYVRVTPTTPGSFVNMRWAPSKSMPVQAKYFADQVLYVIKQNNSWCQVYDVENNRLGFIMRSMVNYYDPAAATAAAES